MSRQGPCAFDLFLALVLVASSLLTALPAVAMEEDAQDEDPLWDLSPRTALTLVMCLHLVMKDPIDMMDGACTYEMLSLIHI